MQIFHNQATLPDASPVIRLKWRFYLSGSILRAITLIGRGAGSTYAAEARKLGPSTVIGQARDKGLNRD